MPVRIVTVPLILISTFALGSSALARDIYLGKHSVAEIKNTCEKAGGSFSQDAKGYGCGTNCHGGRGTDCTVFCPTGDKCVAQVIGARRPRHVLDALKLPERHAR
jgi:hypothetical protein